LTATGLPPVPACQTARGGRPEASHTFEVLPRRWVVERTLAWITSYRRCARDYERLPAHHEAAVYWAMTLMTRRLARGS
jgi:transposase